YEVATRLTLCGHICRKGTSRFRQPQLSLIRVGVRVLHDLGNSN
ncbi:unnamed protein product, partial [Musa textilis]